jgi:hypothetical protein
VLNRVDLNQILLRPTAGNTFNIDITDVTMNELEAAEIAAYTSSCLTTLQNTDYGASKFNITKDSLDRFTGMATAGTITGADDGRNITIPLLTPITKTLTKDVDKIEGDENSVTITYVDTTTESLSSYLPIYLMTESLKTVGSYKYLEDSANVSTDYDLKLSYVGDGTEAADAPFLPTVTDYPQDGTIDLSEIGDGKGTKKGETNHIPPQNTEYYFSFVYNVDGLGNYDMYSLNPKADNTTADVWYGDQDNALSLLAENTGLLYTRPTTATVITEDPIALPAIPSCTISTIADITDTNAHEITLTFNTTPTGLTLGDFTYDTTNGTLSNLAGSGLVWTMDYTANTGITDATNTITFNGSSGVVTDQFGNASTTDTVSNNFEIAAETSIATSVAFSSTDATITQTVSGMGFDLECTATGASTRGTIFYVYASPNYDTGNTYTLKFDANIVSGTPTCEARLRWGGYHPDPGFLTIANGANQIVITDASASNNFMYWYFDTNAGLFDVEITNVRVIVS